VKVNLPVCLSFPEDMKLQSIPFYLYSVNRVYISILCVVSGFLKSIVYHQNARHTLSEIVDGVTAVEYETEVKSWPRVACKINFPCLSCGSVYKYKRDWTRHVKFECNQKPQFCCTRCVSCFTRKSSLMRHIVKFHNGD